MKFLDYGLDDYIIEENFNENDLFCRISRLLNFHVHTNIYISNIEDIYLDKYKGELYFKNYKIRLTYKENLFLHYLIENDGFAKKDQLISYIKNQSGEEYNSKAMVMMVSRLKKKIRYITGFNLIHSKYGAGYYIT